MLVHSLSEIHSIVSPRNGNLPDPAEKSFDLFRL